MYTYVNCVTVACRALHQQKEQVGDDGRGKVGGRSCQGDEDGIAARVLECREIDHDGACPSDMEQQESDGPQRVKVAQRVQAEAPRLDGRRVAKLPCRPGMSSIHGS